MRYLGFDSSTQSLTATVIETDDATAGVVFEDTIAFDEALPSYGTRHGVLAADNGVVGAPPLMWAEALDAMAARMRDAGVDLSRIRAVSGAGQQHGSVYLSARGSHALRTLDPARPLASQLSGAFTRERSPVWLDCSTAAECAAIAAAVGGGEMLASLTGSRAYERFTAAQISKFAREDPDGYARTTRIHLVSSFMASLLCGCDAPLEPGDASGMNLMDIASREWAPSCLAATAPALASRLPPIRDSWTIAGALSDYWRRRFGFGAADVVAWSGDNPSALIGLGLTDEGELGISLGTSDTVFAARTSAAPDPAGAGHVFGSPAGGYMALTCFANGSLARERVRDRYALDWTGFSEHLRRTPAGNDGALMVPWFVPEITPTVDAAGPCTRHLDPADAARNVRAVVEGQAMSMRIHSRWFAPRVTSIRATGGAAANREILQVIADVFAADVVRIAPPNAASLGAALRAFHADRRREGPLSWREAVSRFTRPSGETVHPRPEAVATYHTMLPAYQRLVEDLVNGR